MTFGSPNSARVDGGQVYLLASVSGPFPFISFSDLVAKAVASVALGSMETNLTYLHFLRMLALYCFHPL